LSLNGNIFVYGGDASLNGRLYVSNDASLNGNLFVRAKTRLGNDLSLNGNIFVYGGDASLNGRLYVSNDASLNGNLFVRAKTRLGNDLSLNGNIFVYGGDASLNGRLYVSADVSLNNNLYVGGQIRIYEDIGTVASSQNGSLILEHADASGSSSIVFKSKNDSGDYGYIQYTEHVGGGTGYPGALNNNQNGLLMIGVANNSSSATESDRIVLWSGATDNTQASGKVGINTKFPTATLDVNGNVNATSYNATSDYRVKTNVMALDASFNVDVLKPVTYINTRHGHQDIGFIAHEVQEHYPFLVNGEKDAEQMQSLNYIGLIGILTKEIQDLKRRLAETEAKADNHNQTVNKKIDANMEQVYSMFVSAEAKVASIEEAVASIEEVIENTVASIEKNVASIEETVASVENTVLLEQARLAICETDVALSKSAIKDLEERFQS
jgi:hypothetical protein